MSVYSCQHPHGLTCEKSEIEERDRGGGRLTETEKTSGKQKIKTNRKEYLLRGVSLL